MRKEPAAKASNDDGDGDSDAAYQDLVLSPSIILLLSRAQRVVCVSALARVFPLHTRIHIAHTLTEGGDRFVFVGFNGAAAVCWCACV